MHKPDVGKSGHHRLCKALYAMSENELLLLPAEIAQKSISSREIVLPLKEALMALDIFEQNKIQILGWEGWVKTSDGRVGHGNAPKGTVSLHNLSNEDAAKLCRTTIQADYETWISENTKSTDSVHFCITVKK